MPITARARATPMAKVGKPGDQMSRDGEPQETTMGRPAEKPAGNWHTNPAASKPATIIKPRSDLGKVG